MGLSVFRTKCALSLGGLLALTAGAGSMQANTSYLSSSATSSAAITASITCNTQTGPGAAASFTVHWYEASPATIGTNTYTVGVVPMAGVVVTPPSAVILNSTTNAAGLTFHVAAVAGCASSTSPTTTFHVQLTVAVNSGSAVDDNTATVTDNVTATASALSVQPVTITCGYNSTGPVYVPGSPQTVSVTSAASGGTPFTVTPGTVSGGVITPASLPSWLVVTPTGASGTAGTIPSSFTVQASANCGAFAGVQKTYALPLANLPAPAVTVLITLNATTISPLTATPASLSMSYVISSNVAATANTLVTSSLANAYFTVNTATLPIWLTVNTTGAVVPTLGTTLGFSSTTAASSLSPGTYTATVFLQVSGYGDTPISVSLLVTNKAPTLSVTSANPMPVTYTIGGATPVSTISIASSDSPIPYTMTFGGTLAPMLTAGEEATGIAYSFGSNISITYNPQLFATSPPGTVLTGTVTFTWGSPASVTVVTINLTVTSPAATLTSISPATLPTAAPGSTFTVTLTGSGFVNSTNPALATRVGIVTGTGSGTLNTDTNLSMTYLNPSNLTLTITVPALVSGGNGDPNLPFLVGGAGGQVLIGVVNGTSSIPTGTQTLNIGGGPIIYGVTSSSSFAEVSGGNLPSIAPYDMISIWGANFCSSQTTFPAPVGLNGGCTSTTILPGNPAAPLYIYPTTLTPDQYITPTPPAQASWRNVAVTFYPHVVPQTFTSGTAAPLLFATNSQINAIVPGAVTTTAGTKYDVVVSFGATGAAVNSAPFPVYTVPTDPGIFTIGADGQGQAAALAGGTYALIGASNPAGMRYSASDSDTIQLYMTGLGLPAAGSAYNSNNTTCISALGAGYLAALNATTPAPNPALTTIDGAILLDSLFPGDYPPCLTTEPTVTIGGVTTPAVTYAAFTGDTVAGLYQVNVPLPSTQNTFYPNYPSTAGAITNLTAPTQLPIFVTLNSVTSQAGVTLTVAPKLKMLLTGLTGPSSISAATTASPAVLTTAAAPATGTEVYISGFTGNWAAANGFQVATHVSSTTFSIPVNSSTFGSVTGTPVYTLLNAPYGVSETLSIGHAMNTTTIEGTNNGSDTGVTYAITSGVLPQGLSLSSSGGVATITGTPAQGTSGTYPVTVTATDSSAIPITGTASFTYYIPGGLFVTSSTPTTSTYNSPNTAISTITAVGGAAPYNTFAITSSPVPTGISITSGLPSGNGIIQSDGTTPAGTYTITVQATDAAGTTGTVSVTFVVNLKVTLSVASPISDSITTLGTNGVITVLTVTGGSGSYTYTIDSASNANYLSGGLVMSTDSLELGSDASTGTGNVIIDVVDTGAPPTGGSVTAAPGTQVTISLTLSS